MIYKIYTFQYEENKEFSLDSKIIFIATISF